MSVTNWLKDKDKIINIQGFQNKDKVLPTSIGLQNLYATNVHLLNMQNIGTHKVISLKYYKVLQKTVYT